MATKHPGTSPSNTVDTGRKPGCGPGRGRAGGVTGRTQRRSPPSVSAVCWRCPLATEHRPRLPPGHPTAIARPPNVATRLAAPMACSRAKYDPWLASGNASFIRDGVSCSLISSAIEFVCVFMVYGRLTAVKLTWAFSYFLIFFILHLSEGHVVTALLQRLASARDRGTAHHPHVRVRPPPPPAAEQIHLRSTTTIASTIGGCNHFPKACLGGTLGHVALGTEDRLLSTKSSHIMN